MVSLDLPLILPHAEEGKSSAFNVQSFIECLSITNAGIINDIICKDRRRIRNGHGGNGKHHHKRHEQNKKLFHVFLLAVESTHFFGGRKSFAGHAD